MDGKSGAEQLIKKLLQDPTLLKAVAALPKPDEAAADAPKS
jgi:type VI secretion system protein ImpB